MRGRATCRPVILGSLSAAALLLTACTGSEVALPADMPEPLTAYDRLRVQVAEDFGTLVDPSGLVATPFVSDTQPLDFYGTALLVRTQERLGLEHVDVSPDAVPVDEVQGFRARDGVPDEWSAFALSILGITWTDAGTDGSPSHEEVGTSAEERATRLWLETISGRQGPDTGTRVEIARLIDDPDLGVLGLARLLEACDALEVSCPERGTPVQGSVTIDDVERMLATSATMELRARDIDVSGTEDVDLVDLADAAERTIDTAPGGYEVEVTSLATIAFLADGRTTSFTEYLARSASRRDSATGIYRVYVEARGTIANTYDATLATGPYAPLFLDEHKIVEAVGLDLESRGSGIDPVADAQALYLKSLFESLGGEDEARLQAVVAACHDEDRDILTRVALAQQLPLFDIDECEPRVDPAELEGMPETQRIRILDGALDGVLENSSEITGQWADYLDSLPRLVRQSAADDPLLLDRLGLLASDRDRLSGDEWDHIAEVIGSRTGCAGTPTLVRVAVAEDALCDVGATRTAMSLGLDFGGHLHD